MAGSSSHSSRSRFKLAPRKIALRKLKVSGAPNIAVRNAYKLKAGAALDNIPPAADLIVVPRTEAAEKNLLDAGIFTPIRAKSRYEILRDFLEKPAPSATSEPRATANEALKAAFEPGPRERAILRGVINAQKDLQDAGGAFELDEVRQLLHGVSRQAIDKRVNEGALLAVPGPSGRRRFPAIQFLEDGSLAPGLKAVQTALGYSSPWAVLSFLINAHDLLGDQRPIDLLRRGETEKVEAAARLSGVHAA